MLAICGGPHYLGAVLGRWLWLMTTALVLLAARPASAQHEGQDAASDAPASDAPASDDSAMVERFEQAQQLYREGRFAEAVDVLRELIAVKPEPVLYYNLARAYDGDGKLAEAIDAYRRFLELSPEVEDRGAIEKRIETLQGQLDERERAARESNKPAPPPPADKSTPVVPWILTAVGAATLIVGAVLGGMSLSAGAAADDATVHADAAEAQTNAEDFALGANINFVAGGALAAAGAIWLIVDATASPSEQVGARMSLRF